MEGELSSEVGLAGRLFKSCVDLFWALLQRVSHLNIEQKQKEALRDEFGRFYFWGDGYYPYEGRLDEILLNSSRLRHRVLLLMVEIGQPLCGEKSGLLSLVGRDLRNPELDSQCTELRTLIDVVLESFDEPSGSGSDTDSDAAEIGDALQEITDYLKARNQCLIDLSGSLDRPAADASFAEPRTARPISFTVSGPAEIWTRKIVDSFPHIDITLAQRLGEANWQRYQRVSRKLEAMVPLDSDSDDDEDSEDDELGDLPNFTETTKSSKEQSSIFSSQAPQSSGVGTTATSISETGFENAFPRSRKLKARDLLSQATYTSVLAEDQGETGWLKIPALPKNALLDKAFQCTVCGEKLKDIMSRTDWKRHVFADLAPYICTFADCKLGLASFATRKSWADHEFAVHRVSKSWLCKDCGSGFSEREKYRNHAKWNHTPIFSRGQLELLVDSAEKQTGPVVSDQCPFCPESPGTKVRTFSMHVAKHMEEIALAVLPRDSEFEDDLASLSSNGNVPSSRGSIGFKDNASQRDVSPGLSTGPKSDITAPKLEYFNGNGKKRAGLDDLDFLSTIGRGNFAKVLLAEAKVSKRLYAVKIRKKEVIVENSEIKQVEEEKNVLILATKERHPFIVQLGVTFQTETRIYFVLEYLGGGDLMYHIQKDQFGHKRAQFYATQVLLALGFLHKNNTIYRDLKLDNILLAADGYIKIIDFGLCKSNMKHDDKTSTFCGEPEFMAPEILLDKKYGKEVDYWAFGVLLYQMLLQQSPFRGEDEDEIYDSILADEPLYPIHLPRDTVSILQNLLTREQESRLGSGPAGTQAIMDHPFFRNISWDDIYHKRVQPMFVPEIKTPTDVSNFDTEFTSVTPILTPVQSVLSQAMQEEFRGFSHMVEH